MKIPLLLVVVLMLGCCVNNNRQHSVFVTSPSSINKLAGPNYNDRITSVNEEVEINWGIEQSGFIVPGVKIYNLGKPDGYLLTFDIELTKLEEFFSSLQSSSGVRFDPVTESSDGFSLIGLRRGIRYKWSTKDGNLGILQTIRHGSLELYQVRVEVESGG